MRTLSRSIESILLATALLTGCHKTVPTLVPDVSRSSPEQIVGAILVNGTRVEFSAQDGRIVRDTVYATKAAPIPLDSVSHLLIRKGDPVMTFFAVLGGVAAAAGVAIGIALATKESCPFVYAWDGTRWVFDAEPYGGAITRGLERDDYGLLEHLKPVDGEYRLLMVNEVRESQMTDLAQLLVVDHAPGLQPVPDEFGRLYSVADPKAPLRATDQRGVDLLPWLIRRDDLVWETRPSADLSRTRDTVTLTFARPEGAGTMKLVARVATGAWGSHQIRSLLGLYGTSVGAWYKNLDANPLAADSIRKWSIREGLYGLTIEVREPDGWQVRGVLAGGGPFLAEDRVVPLDVSRVAGSTVEIRITPARSYWGLNWFAADYSPDRSFQVDTVAVSQATDEHLGDVRDLLRQADGRYSPLPATGDYATLAFAAPPERAGLERTVFLHARGWYNLRGLPDQPADTAAIRRVFTEPGFAARLAAEEYRRGLLARRN
jgi:hypothetical protein